MFIVTPVGKNEVQRALANLYKKIKKTLGFVPPHFELFGSIDMKSLQDFVEYNLYFNKHPKIDATLLPYLRLYIAQQESREYCIAFNTKMLLVQGAEKGIVKNMRENIERIPFKKEQVLLLKKVLYAVYNAKEFERKDLQELYDAGFNDKDFYELLSYATNFMAKSKMIEVYLKYNK